MIATESEIAASRRHVQWIVGQQARHARNPASEKPPEGQYQTWCYCSWCPNSGVLTPHYVRPNCPKPGEYRHGR